MRRLLQRASDGLYYAAPDRWTADPKGALHFEQSLDAVWLAIRDGLHPVQVVLTFDEPSHNITVPLDPTAGVDPP